MLVRAAWALLRPSSLELGGVGIYDSEDRRIFSDLSQISTTLEHGFYVKSKANVYRIIDNKESNSHRSKTKIHSPMNFKADGLSASRN